ncbi:MAG: hypothetical protein LBV09_00005, partial [Deferribacteraceae bacterium]|nr:hypothetical protein [Deferribacteraceae bacterium]
EEFIEQMFPNKCVRLDGDNISSFKQLSTILSDFHNGKKQILVGTQLIAKGLHFPNVTFVGIMGIDNVLAMPEFRSLERGYQLLMQVSGRAGRGAQEGVVHIQTQMPEHPIFQYISTDPEDFYQFELARRESFSYPPYSKLARLVFSHSKEGELKAVSAEVTNALAKSFKNVRFMGPAPAVIFKIKNRYRISVLIKADTHKEMGAVLKACLPLFDRYKKGTMQMRVDRDPYFFM